MKIPGKEHLTRITVNPGEYYVTNEEAVISTLLGSCVSACLYDPVGKIIGMNHFLLSNMRYAKDMPYYVTEAGRYGIHAMELLINELLEKGAKRHRLRAKAFGGSSLFPTSGGVGNFFCVGDVNTRFIKDFLANEGIPLVSENLGGDRGRVIHFNSSDFSVYVRKIQKTVNTKLGLREKQFWQKSIESQERNISEPDIFV